MTLAEDLDRAECALLALREAVGNECLTDIIWKEAKDTYARTRDPKDAALVGVALAARVDARMAVSEALTMSPASLALRIRARHVREAAQAYECMDDHDETGAHCPRRWLLDLAKQIEQAPTSVQPYTLTEENGPPDAQPA